MGRFAVAGGSQLADTFKCNTIRYSLSVWLVVLVEASAKLAAAMDHSPHGHHDLLPQSHNTSAAGGRFTGSGHIHPTYIPSFAHHLSDPGSPASTPWYEGKAFIGGVVAGAFVLAALTIIVIACLVRQLAKQGCCRRYSNPSFVELQRSLDVEEDFL